jgi:DNA primase
MALACGAAKSVHGTEDHNPSLTVFPATGTFHCFGCRKRGDVITFLREIEHVGFREALDALDNLSAQPS